MAERDWYCNECNNSIKLIPPNCSCPKCGSNNTIPKYWKKTSEEVVEHQKRQAIVTEYEGIEFVAILPDMESDFKADVNVTDISAGVEMGKKKGVQAFIVNDPRLPTSGPVPQTTWVKYWDSVVENMGKYQTHLSSTITHTTGVRVSAEDIDLRGTITPTSGVVMFSTDAVLEKKDK